MHRLMLRLCFVLLLQSAPLTATAFASASRSIDDQHLTVPARIEAGRQELARLPTAHPSNQRRRSEIQKSIAALLGRIEGGDASVRIEERLAAYKEALVYFTRDRAPDTWASLQVNMGVSLGKRVRGSRLRNTEAALSAYRAALTVATRQHDPELWALAQNNLGATLNRRIAGSAASNREAARKALLLALEVRTKTAFPDAFATTAKNLAIVMEHRTQGLERENLDVAIALLVDALAIRRRDGPEVEGVGIARKLGLLYARRSKLDDAPPSDDGRAIDLLSVSLGASEPGLDAEDRVEALVELGLAAMRRFTTSGDGRYVEKAVQAYEHALAARAREDDPVAWAAVQDHLGDALMERLDDDNTENKERALAAYRLALAAVSPSRNRDEWATYKGDIGRAYDDRTKGDRKENLRHAVDAYHDALRYTSRKKDADRWSSLQNNLCVAYSHLIPEGASFAELAIQACGRALPMRHGISRSQILNNLATVYIHRPGGSRAVNIRNAIAYLEEALTLLPREVDPLGWAMMQDNLGTAYRENIGGDPATNAERAIARFDQALTVRTRKNTPKDWAATQNNLALTYMDRIWGDRTQNVERAIESYRAALSIYTQVSDPWQWAAINDNLGNALMDRHRESAEDNIEKAIEAYNLALKVRTKETAPIDWAGTTNNLALAYGSRLAGNPNENRERAIKHFLHALEVQSKQNTPTAWATTMHNLAVSTARRPEGDNGVHIDKAIGYYNQALTVRTRTAMPYEWAETTTNLARLFIRRQLGDPSSNLEIAIRLYGKAAAVRTRTSDPLGYLGIQRGLADAYGNRIVGNRADNQRARMDAYQAAMETVDDLLDAGVDPAQTSIVMEAAGEVFRDAALQAARDGDLASALDIAERGRTRALRQALRLDTAADSLAPDKRQLLEEARASLETGRAALRADRGDDHVARAIRQDELRRRIEEAQARIRGLLPRRDEHRTMPPAPPDGGAIVIPVVAKGGAVLLLVTSRGISSVSLPDFDDARMRRMFFGADAKTWGRGGWSRTLKVDEKSGIVMSTTEATWREAMEDLGRDVSARIVGPLVAELDNLGVVPGSPLIFVLQDNLARMPIWLAPNPRSRKSLAETYSVTLSPDLSRLEVPPRTGTRGIAAWINGRSEPPLHTAHAAEALIRPSATVLDGATVTRSSPLIQELSGHSTWILWTHGRFDRRDVRASGLQLEKVDQSTPEFLTVDDLLGARFGQKGPDLVVLLACVSGLVDVAANDELAGLSTALLQAGSRGVISALWSVDENATTLLAAKLSEFLAQGLPGSFALTSAQEWLRGATGADLKTYIEERQHVSGRSVTTEKAYSLLLEAFELNLTERPYANPYYWGAFVFAGSDRPGGIRPSEGAPH